MCEYTEKREFIRMNADCNMTFRFVDSDQQHIGKCINLSGAGIFFKTEKLISPGKAIEITFQPENNITQPLNAFVEVLRVSGDHNGTYEIAGSIKGIKAT